MLDIILILVSYLIGSIPTGYLLGKRAGVDVRTVGSGNVGATNVARVAGKGRGALTLLLDAAKGWVPVFAAMHWENAAATAALAGVAACLGHVFPVFLRFRGGKGVATALGVLVALAPMAALVLVGIFSLVFLVGRFVSLGSIVTAAAAPVVFWLTDREPIQIIAVALIAGVVVLRHAGNIRRLLDGSEPKFGAANSR